MTEPDAFTTEQAAAILDVPASLIALWKHRKRIMPCGYAAGRGPVAPLYHLEELRPLVDEWRRRTATRRAKA